MRVGECSQSRLSTGFGHHHTSCTYTHPHIPTPTYARICTHAHTHTHMSTHTRTHTHTWTLLCSIFFLQHLHLLNHTLCLPSLPLLLLTLSPLPFPHHFSLSFHPPTRSVTSSGCVQLAAGLASTGRGGLSPASTDRLLGGVATDGCGLLWWLLVRDFLHWSLSGAENTL